MTLVDVDAVVVRAATIDVESQDPSGEVVIVRVHDHAGRIGLAECNHSAPMITAALTAAGTSSFSAGIHSALVGRDIEERPAIVDALYERNVFSWRRGGGLALLHAIDVCLWDLLAQTRGEPLWRTLWGEQVHRPIPYVTLYTGHGNYDRSASVLAELIENSRAAGYRMAKVEPLADCVPVDRIVDFVALARDLLDDTTRLALDFGHRFRTADEALPVIERVAQFDLEFVETPMLTDDVAEYARLAERSPVPVAASELYESPWEFRALIDAGGVDVAQPWINRLGITGTRVVADMAADADCRCVLAGWNATAIGVAAGLHFAAGMGTDVSVEHAPAASYELPLRAVATPDPVVRGGELELPTEPGLGVELDDEAVLRLEFPRNGHAHR